MTILDNVDSNNVLNTLCNRLIAGQIVKIEFVKDELHGMYFGSDEAGEIVYRFLPFYRRDPNSLPTELRIKSDRLGGLTIERNQENHELFDKAYALITQIVNHGSPATKSRLLDALI